MRREGVTRSAVAGYPGRVDELRVEREESRDRERVDQDAQWTPRHRWGCTNGHGHAPGANLRLKLTRMCAGKTLPAIRQDRKKTLMFRDLISHVRTRLTTSRNGKSSRSRTRTVAGALGRAAGRNENRGRGSGTPGAHSHGHGRLRRGKARIRDARAHDPALQRQKSPGAVDFVDGWCP